MMLTPGVRGRWRPAQGKSAVALLVAWGCITAACAVGGCSSDEPPPQPTKASPDAPPFIERGQRVSSDTTVCIVEAMKVFNEIKAECSGTIVDILCENEDSVEFNQPMFKVDTSK